jgi:small conductance mechanosensitive channel
LEEPLNFDFNIARFWENYGQDLLDIGRRLIIIIMIIAGGKTIITISRRLTQKAVSGKLKLDENLSSVLRMAIQYGIIIICLIMILDILGINTTGLIALLGAAGVAVGFSLKDTLGNIAAGIIILFLRPFRKGDFIECGSVNGSVREMGLFAATLETPDGIFISAPNSSIWGLPLKNYSHNPKRRMDITVSISYSDSIDTAFRILNGTINEEKRFLTEPPGQVMVQSLGESGIGITLRAWVSSGDYWEVYWDQMKNVKEKIQEAGLTIAFPKRDIRLIRDFRDPKTEYLEHLGGK